MNWMFWARAVLAASVSVAASSAPAALITFSGLDSNPQGTPVTSSYQPLLNTYTGTSSNGNPGNPGGPYSDGSNIGVTVTWDGGSSTSNHGVNGGVTDHTNDSAGTVWYDNGNSTMGITFSAPVTIPDFFFAYYNNGPANPIFKGYTNPGDATPAVTINGSYPGGAYNWQESGFGSTPLRQIILSHNDGAYMQIDDMTVLPVPEPATWILAAFGAVALFISARRSRA